VGKEERIMIAYEYIKRAKRKIESAKLLLKNKFIDDAVSRAYYAVFLAAYAVLYLLGETPKTHEGLIHLFGVKLIMPGIVEKKYGRILSRLRQLREESDYAAYVYVDEDEAKELIDAAIDFLKKMEELVNKIAKEE